MNPRFFYNMARGPNLLNWKVAEDRATCPMITNEKGLKIRQMGSGGKKIYNG